MTDTSLADVLEPVPESDTSPADISGTEGTNDTEDASGTEDANGNALSQSHGECKRYGDKQSEGADSTDTDTDQGEIIP